MMFRDWKFPYLLNTNDFHIHCTSDVRSGVNIVKVRMVIGVQFVIFNSFYTQLSPSQAPISLNS